MTDFQDLMHMTATIYGEARGEPIDGQYAVAWVILNRARKGGWWGSSIQDVVMKPYQFSCWNDSDPNSGMVRDIAFNWARKASVMFEPLEVQDALHAAIAVSNGHINDLTRGATHYHHKHIRPSWAQEHEPNKRIGNHLFYKGIK